MNRRHLSEQSLMNARKHTERLSQISPCPSANSLLDTSDLCNPLGCGSHRAVSHTNEHSRPRFGSIVKQISSWPTATPIFAICCNPEFYTMLVFNNIGKPAWTSSLLTAIASVTTIVLHCRGILLDFMASRSKNSGIEEFIETLIYIYVLYSIKK